MDFTGEWITREGGRAHGVGTRGQTLIGYLVIEEKTIKAYWKAKDGTSLLHTSFDLMEKYVPPEQRR